MLADRTPGESGVHAIVGPTGVGKSAVATDLASATGAPILVADRIQCFTELAVTSGRAADEGAKGTNRIWLSNRTVSDGDYPVDDAVEALLIRLGSLVGRHRFVIMEGGSISILLRFAEKIGDLPFPVSVQVLRITDKEKYLALQRKKARSLLVRTSSGKSLLTEFVVAWTTPGRRFFTATLSGLDSVLEWCAKYSVPPEKIADLDLSEGMLDELSSMIGERWAEHGFIQEEIFSQLFPS